MSEVNAVTVDLKVLAGRCDGTDENDFLSRTSGLGVARAKCHWSSKGPRRFCKRVTSEMFPSLHPNAGASCTFLEHRISVSEASGVFEWCI